MIQQQNEQNYYDLATKGLENDLPNIKIVLPLIKKNVMVNSRNKKRDATKHVLDSE